jgi:hypothetical protein
VKSARQGANCQGEPGPDRQGLGRLGSAPSVSARQERQRGARLVLAWLGAQALAWRGLADSAVRGGARYGPVCRGLADADRQGGARRGQSGTGMARLGMAVSQGGAWLRVAGLVTAGQVWLGEAERGRASQGLAG